MSMSCFNLDMLFKPALRLGLALKGVQDYVCYQPAVPDKKEHIGSKSDIPSVAMPMFAPPSTEADLQKMRQLIADDVPFLIQWPEDHPVIPAEKSQAVEAYLHKTLAEDGYKDDDEFLIVKFEKWHENYGELDKFVQGILPRLRHPRLNWPLWFLGNYSTSGPHVDAMFGSVNVYYMAHGSKYVKILTRAATERLPVHYKDDYLFPLDSSEIPKYPSYEGVLKENSVLVFSNSACLHIFENLPGPKPRELSLRLKYTGKVHPLIIETAMCSWDYVEHVTKLIRNAATKGKLLRTNFVK